MHARLASWQPILEGELHDRAERHVRTILADLHAASDLQSPALAGGEAGVAMLLAYLAAARSDADAPVLARERLERAARALAEIVLYPDFYAGFTGIAWAHAHLERDLYGPSDIDAAEDVDAALLRLLDLTPWPHHYDLVSGLVGFAVYALERLPRLRARDVLARIVAKLDETASSNAAGTFWHTAPRLLPPRTRLQYPEGSCNLGVAHGMPGVIAVLAAAVAHGIGGDAATRLLHGTIDWLVAQRLRGRDDAWFAIDTIGPGAREPSRLAWCYGDAGIAAALCAASQVCAAPRLRDLALCIGRAAAARDPASSGVVDAGLCHGAAGLGHLFNRLFQATGDEAFLDAARAWFARTLDLRRPGLGLGGYPAWTLLPGSDDRYGWVAEPGLLTGACGVAAALLAATSAVPPSWDRFLLLSLPIPAATSAPHASRDLASARRGDA